MSGKIIAVLAVSGLGLGALYIYTHRKKVQEATETKISTAFDLIDPNSDFMAYLKNDYGSQKEFDFAVSQGVFTDQVVEQQLITFEKNALWKKTLGEQAFNAYMLENDLFKQLKEVKNDQEYDEFLTKHYKIFKAIKHRGKKTHNIYNQEIIIDECDPKNFGSNAKGKEEENESVCVIV